MCIPVRICEKRIRPSPIQVSPVAFENNLRGAPPLTGTIQVSHAERCELITVYAMCEPSGEKYGVRMGWDSFVSCIGCPSGNIFTQIWPRLINEVLPRMKATICSSADRIGAVAPS